MGIEIVGEVTCPHCGNTATVHKQRKAGQKLYYRCYSEKGGAKAICGTVQITGPKGQEWLRQNTKFFETQAPIGEISSRRTAIGESQVAGEQEEKQKSTAIGGFLANFWKDDEE